jgi:aromatic ring-opening dioxygenase catalytic subunit (LigB family)
MTASVRQPSIFLSHGGGPCFWMSFPPPFGPHAFDSLRAYLAGLLDSLPAPPTAVLAISGHWEAPVATVGSAAAPGMLFDYYGFPPHTYQLSYPAPGSPALAARVRALLGAAGIASAADAERGFDHGVFVPFLIIDPDARIPVVTLSLRQDLDPAAHLAIGAALAPLRDEGVLIVGSGNSFHNLTTFFNGEPAAAAAFDAWLTEAVTAPDPAVRAARLIGWADAPQARACHPREEHLIPLMVAAGAAGGDPGRRVFSDRIGGKAISGFAFGG